MTIVMQICCLNLKENSLFLISPGEEPSSPPRKRFVEVTGEGPVGQTMACLEMLARHHNVPFRRDVIERAAKDNLSGQRATSLELDWQLIYINELHRNVGRFA